mgnify:CR=1 FL=1
MPDAASEPGNPDPQPDASAAPDSGMPPTS